MSPLLSETATRPERTTAPHIENASPSRVKLFASDVTLLHEAQQQPQDYEASDGT